MPAIEVLLERPGRSPLRLTPVQESLHWTTQAVGGFGECGFRLPGDPRRWKSQLDFLSTVRLVFDATVIWEGRAEDVTLKIVGDDLGAEVAAYGYQRLLDDNTVRRIWSQRDIEWKELRSENKWSTTIGQIDDTDLTRIGVRIAGLGDATTSGNDKHVRAHSPQGLTWVRILGHYGEAGTVANFNGQITSSADGSAYTLGATLNGAQDFAVALVASARIVGVDLNNTASWTPNDSDVIAFEDMRLLGTSLTEDATGGFYGGTILRDLIALVPELTQGLIDDGSDFTIEEIERAVRSSIREVVEEVASYYGREWRVWEGPSFEWRAVNVDEPQWITVVSELADGTEITGTVEGIAETVYVLYTDVDQRDKETTASSTDQRNPFVRQSKTRETIFELGDLIARGKRKRARRRATTVAQRRATQLANDVGTYPAVQGTIVLPAGSVIRRAAGSPLPAWMIRGGENIVVSDFPKSDVFSQGRDGETLFHIVSTEADLEEGQVTLEVEGQQTRSDVILARLAAATRF